MFQADVPFVVCLAAGAIVCYIFIRSRSRTSLLPPGPPGYPFIGNLLDLNTPSVPKLFADLEATYAGDIIHISVFGKSTVILNSESAVIDLLEKRGAIYSNRPRLVLLGELHGWDDATPHLQYGPRLRRHRQFMGPTMSDQAMRTRHKDLLRTVTAKLIEGFATTPEKFSGHIEQFSASTIMSLGYGHDIELPDDPLIRSVFVAMTTLNETGALAATLVDSFPIFKYVPSWFPFAEFKREAKVARAQMHDMYNIPFNMVKEQLAKGIERPSLMSELIAENGGLGHVPHDIETDIKGVGASLFAVYEFLQTTGTLLVFILAMMLHPEALRKAQHEIDTVVGRDRLPYAEDRPALPYVNALYLEVLRWGAPSPMGLPHAVMHRGFAIPKDATIIPNVYAMMRKCKNPEDFIPERFLEGATEKITDPTIFAFGFGRRVCPGRYLADHSVWLVIAQVIATFDIFPPEHERKIEFIVSFVR
ncbi:cytochrome P450 [Fistulina hepatica ATCC 64428]|nr:cytochrome P450 [Fistulina hepatica ATCC 64428]